MSNLPPERIWIPANSNCPLHPQERWLTGVDHHDGDTMYMRADLAAGSTEQILTMLEQEKEEHRKRGLYDLEEHWGLLIERINESIEIE